MRFRQRPSSALSGFTQVGGRQALAFFAGRLGWAGCETPFHFNELGPVWVRRILKGLRSTKKVPG